MKLTKMRIATFYLLAILIVFKVQLGLTQGLPNKSISKSHPVSSLSEQKYIQNPVLPGFNPDPDIICVSDDYYIATTTFEWYPGINIYHSKDLIHWDIITQPLLEKHINLNGVPNSGGNYIPSLLFNQFDSLFYLVYSNVLDRQWPLMAMQCFVITSKEISGPWSEPVYLNSVGFDPAFFFDDNGKAYLINMILDYRNNLPMPGFTLQEYDIKLKKLVGDAKVIFHVNDYGEQNKYMLPEGPHIYKKDGFYYLLFAAGGTYWQHQSWMARSKNIWGDYELAPNNPLLTSIGIHQDSLQKAGQGALVETQSGEWYLAHHASRPLMPDSVSPLGRETCLQKVEWTEDGWLQLAHPGNHPREKVPAPNLPVYRNSGKSTTHNFNDSVLPPGFQSLREPFDDSWISLERKPGKLSVRGRQPITSLIGQSLIARRWITHNFEAETCIAFQPEHFLQMAGLTLFYDTEDFQQVYVTHDEEMGRVVRLMQWTCENGGLKRFPDVKVPVPGDSAVYLKVIVEKGKAQFLYAMNSNDWKVLGPLIPVNHLSDEGINGNKNGFTGAFVGISVVDRLYESKWTEIDFFNYKKNQLSEW